MYCWFRAVDSAGLCQLGTVHPFNGLFSWTTWVSRYQKGETSLDLNEARDDGVFFLPLNQQRESTEGKSLKSVLVIKSHSV